MTEDVKKTIIRLKDYEISKIWLTEREKEKHVSDELQEDDLEIGIKTFNHGENEEVVALTVKTNTEKKNVEIEMKGFFVFLGGETEEMKEKFLNINAAAILYPYIRAYISTITSFDKNGSTLILPTINFQRLYQAKKREEERNSDTK